MKIRPSFALSIVGFTAALMGCSFDNSNNLSDDPSEVEGDSGIIDTSPDASVNTPADAKGPEIGDTDAEGGVLGIVPTGPPSQTSIFGNDDGGDSFVFDCPNGSFLYGYESRYLTDGASGLCEVSPKCGKLAISNGFTTRESVSTPAPSPAIGNCRNSATNPSNNSDVECPGNTIASGFRVTAPGYVTAISLRCSSLTLDADSNLTATPEPLEQATGDLFCADNQIAFGFTGAGGWVVDRVGVQCIEISTMAE